MSNKPPKLRFRPGCFVQKKPETKKGVGQLYRIDFAYRVRDQPNVWCFRMTEVASTEYGLSEKEGRVEAKPYHSHMDAMMDFDRRFGFGGHGSDCRDTPQLLNDFQFVSEGETTVAKTERVALPLSNATITDVEEDI